MRVFIEEENSFEKMPHHNILKEACETFPWLMIDVGESISPGHWYHLVSFIDAIKKISLSKPWGERQKTKLGLTQIQFLYLGKYNLSRKDSKKVNPYISQDMFSRKYITISKQVDTISHLSLDNMSGICSQFVHWSSIGSHKWHGTMLLSTFM